MLKDQLDKKLFWDIDFNKLDVDKRKEYIIERVLDRAITWEHFKAIIQYYGKKEVANVAKNIRYLDDKTIHFCSVYFDIPLNEFRCYTLKQSLPKHWN